MADHMPTQTQNLENLNKELESIGPQQPQPEEQKKPVRQRRKTPSKQKVVITRGKRKRAVARVRLIRGNGRITINNINVNTFKPREIRELILEPVNFSPLTKEIADSSDIKVSVSGGGMSGQAQAVRVAIAKAITEASSTDVVGKAFMKYDRTFLVDDVRRVEPKKYRGPKARARFQKSYR